MWPENQEAKKSLFQWAADYLWQPREGRERGWDVGVQTRCCHSVLTPNLLFLKTEEVLNVFRQVKAESIPPTDSLGRGMLFLVTMGNTWQQFKGENILFQFVVVGKAWRCPQWQKHGAEVLSIIADWKQMIRGRRMVCSYQVPSLVVYIIPSQALGPSSSTMPKSIPPGRDDIQTQEPMAHFPFCIAGHLKGFFSLFLRKKIKLRGDSKSKYSRNSKQASDTL